MLRIIDKAKTNGNLSPADVEETHAGWRQNKMLSDAISTLRNEVLLLEEKLVRMQYFAYHDDLTGLPNRSLFHDRVNQAMKRAARNRTKMSLLLLDLNGFKAVNDTCGHGVGDMLLRQVSDRLLAAIRAEDSVYRYGGDEFIVLLPEVDGARGATALMRKLHRHLAEPYRVDTHRFAVTASIGKAMYPEDGISLAELITCADAAMYLAKTQRRDPLKIPPEKSISPIPLSECKMRSSPGNRGKKPLPDSYDPAL